MIVHGVAQDPFPRDVDAFLLWVARMNGATAQLGAERATPEPYARQIAARGPLGTLSGSATPTAPRSR